MPEYLCAFDLGTTGVKAGLLTPAGELLATAYREYRVLYPNSQWVEQSIIEMWQAQCQVSQELLEKSGIAPNDIAAVAVSSQRATFVPVDKDEIPLTNFIGWQDKRSIQQTEEMKQLVGIESYYRIAGLPLDPTAAASKILWLKDNQPDIFEQTAYFASTQNIHLKQLGIQNSPCDLPDAAYMGLLDVDKLAWSQHLLNILGIPSEKLPPLVPSGTLVGEISKEAAYATGLSFGTHVVTAGGDLQVAGLGLGITEPGLASLGIGTGGGVLIFLEKPRRHPTMGLNCLPHAISDVWEMEGICLGSGAVYRWFRDTLGTAEKEAAAERGKDSYTFLNDAAAKVPPGANGVMFMPSFIGSGAPNWYPKSRGAVLGLTLSTDKATLTRALLEGVCFEIRWMLEAVKTLGVPLNEIRIWGGAAKSALWNQIAADIYGLPMTRTRVDDAGLVGAAICAGIGTGIFRNAQQGVSEMVHTAEQYEPDHRLKARYDEMFDLYKTTYQALLQAGCYDRLSCL